ncbi:hypothetical protein ACWGN5_35415 [Streptomyces sp. NPDC055815]
MVLDPVTSTKITRYRPKNVPPVWVEVAPLVRSVVAAAVTAVPYDVERLLHVVGRLALWAEAAGIERTADAWLRNEVIDAFVLSRAGDIAASSVRTYRTWLLRVRDALAWIERGEAPPARMHAEASPHQTYSTAELAGLRHWATHLPRQRKTDALALLGLGAGLGLTPKEVAASRGIDLRRPRRDDRCCTRASSGWSRWSPGPPGTRFWVSWRRARAVGTCSGRGGPSSTPRT